MSYLGLTPRKLGFLVSVLLCTVGNALAAPQLTGRTDWDTSTPESGTDGEWSGKIPFIPSHYYTVRVAHAVLASAAWLIFFPLGAILIRTIETGWDYGDVRIHAVIQMVGYAIFIAAAGMDIWMAKTGGVLNYYHPITGIVLLICLAIQPLTELLNARFYSKFPRMIWLAHLHIWFGRLLITAGIIQGGLGFVFSASLPMATADAAPRIAYGVVAVIVWVLYVSLAIVWPEVKHTFGWWRRRNAGRGEEGGLNLRARSLSEAAAPSAIDRSSGGWK